MDYGYSGYNPYQSRMPVDNIVKVPGEEGAKSYQMPPNSRVALFDTSEDRFFLKTTDGTGYPTMRRFRFYEEFPEEPMLPDMSQYVTKTDLSNLESKVDHLIESLGGANDGK